MDCTPDMPNCQEAKGAKGTRRCKCAHVKMVQHNRTLGNMTFMQATLSLALS